MSRYDESRSGETTESPEIFDNRESKVGGGGRMRGERGEGGPGVGVRTGSVIRFSEGVFDSRLDRRQLEWVSSFVLAHPIGGTSLLFPF